MNGDAFWSTVHKTIKSTHSEIPSQYLFPVGQFAEKRFKSTWNRGPHPICVSPGNTLSLNHIRCPRALFLRNFLFKFNSILKTEFLYFP